MDSKEHQTSPYRVHENSHTERKTSELSIAQRHAPLLSTHLTTPFESSPKVRDGLLVVDSFLGKWTVHSLPGDMVMNAYAKYVGVMASPNG